MGVDAQGTHGGPNVVTTLSGARGLLYNTGAGTVTHGAALYGQIQNLGGIITNAYGVRADVSFNYATLTNTYGVYVGDVTEGVQTNQAYSFFSSDVNARNSFAGPVLMPSLTAGAAGGKRVVCVDLANGQLYASSTSTDCSN